MKHFKIFSIAAALLLGIATTSCDDYLNIKPKKQAIPETLDDYTAFFNEEYILYTPHIYSSWNADFLLGEYYYSYINYYSSTDLDYILYYWTDGDRYSNNSSMNVFSRSYRGIAVANQIIEGAASATDCTESERQSAIASARILRVLQYFHVSQYFADAYDPATADVKLAVPVILSSDVNATYTQPTLKEFYQFMLDELQLAIDSQALPDYGATMLVPGRGAAYAAMARVRLQMRDYEGALEYANKALSINSELFDWVEHYKANYEDFFAHWSYSKMLPSVMEHDFVENYYFGHGLNSHSTVNKSLPLAAGELFEEGDCFFKCNWILEPWYGGAYYCAASSGFFNLGGLRTVEQYYIKAECLARLGHVDQACEVLNTVRRKLIDPDVYQDFITTSTDEAIIKIRDSKHSTLMGSTMGLADAKRFNCEGKYIFRPKKIINGEIRYLEPDDRLWTFPFAKDVMGNLSKGNITQNAEY